MNEHNSQKDKQRGSMYGALLVMFKLSDKAVISPPACLTELDWKIISDGCLNQ